MLRYCQHPHEELDAEILQDNAENVGQHQGDKNSVNEVGVLGHDQGTGLQAVYHHHAQHDGGKGVTGNAQRKQRNHCAAHAGVVCSFGSHDAAHISGSVFLGMF